MGVTSNGLPYPENSDFVADGAMAIKDLADNVNAKAGLWLVHTQDFSASDPLDILGVFSSKYLNYKVQLVYYGSTSSSLNMWFFSGTNTLFNSASGYLRYGFTYSAGGTTTNAAAAATNMALGNHGSNSDVPVAIDFDMLNVTATGRTYVYANLLNPDTGLWSDFKMQTNTTTAFTGLRFDAASGSITGKMRIYGYNQ